MLQKIWRIYNTSWWISSLVFVLIAVSAFAAQVVNSSSFLLMCAACAGIFLVSALNFFRKRWVTASINLLSFVIVGFMLLGAIAVERAFMSDGGDDFTENLIIPPDIELTTPEPIKKGDITVADDVFQQTLLNSLNTPGHDNASMQADISALASAYQNNRDNLLRYFATNSAWRLFTQQGKLFATRRWSIDGNWRITLHGYYTSSDIDKWQKESDKKFQTRTTISFTEAPWSSYKNVTLLHSGEKQDIPLKQESGQFAEFDSYIIIQDDGLSVEITEQSAAKQRRLTEASLSYLNTELEPIAMGSAWSEVQKGLPKGSIRKGSPSLDIYGSGGIYDVYIRANPGESGMVYLKAFEVTKNTPLSQVRLKKDSSEWIGWSDNSEEQFLSNSHITIGEGNWGQYYAARFEVWFAPASGAPERKLIDRAFKIEGWQR